MKTRGNRWNSTFTAFAFCLADSEHRRTYWHWTCKLGDRF